MPRMPLPLLLAAGLVAGSPAATAVAAGGGGGEGGVHLVEMREIVVPIVEGDRADGRLRVTLVLQLADAESAARIEAELPALREAGMASASEFARLYASPFVAVDAHRLAEALTADLHGREPAIASVLLVGVSTNRA